MSCIYIERSHDHSGENVEDAVAFFGGRGRRASEVCLVASDFDEAARARSDGLRETDQLRLQCQSYLFANKLRTRAQDQRALILTGVAGAALKLFCQHYCPFPPRDIGESYFDSGLSFDRFASRSQCGDVRRFEMSVGDGDSFEALFDEREEDVADQSRGGFRAYRNAARKTLAEIGHAVCQR